MTDAPGPESELPLTNVRPWGSAPRDLVLRDGITTTAGGLGETATDRINGLTTPPSHPGALASAIAHGLTLTAH
ncbi:hypothetical protein RIF23_10440 [Lipingzhangella sp. LS1_29]|uniref:Uncharacterized protein n=1 Tax=Lipingzhangella rawalii TaxID=2055835 RepID=A0ABU2H5Y7_9ACTN|nr:hypothetical protein [Lipingzhangella rawalii]MDS1270717.1 hypothetical protein [Lipingzhangella rawalii]